MDCEQVRGRLSSFFDDELSTDSRAKLSAHLESCRDCTDELEAFQNLSLAAGELIHPSPPATIWTNVEAQLNAKADDTEADNTEADNT